MAKSKVTGPLLRLLLNRHPAAHTRIFAFIPASRNRPARDVLVLAEEHVLELAKSQDDRYWLAKMQEKLGRTFSGIGDPDRAIGLLTQSIANYRSVTGLDSKETLVARRELAQALLDAGRIKESLSEIRETFDCCIQEFGPKDVRTIEAMVVLGNALRRSGHVEESIAVDEECLARAKQSLPDDNRLIAVLMSNLSVGYAQSKQHEQAFELRLQTVALHERVSGSDHPLTLQAKANLARSYAERGDLEKAILILCETLPVMTKVLGRDHHKTMNQRNSLAGFLIQAGRKNDAAPLRRQTVESCRRVFGGNAPETRKAENQLESLLNSLGRTDEALVLANERLANARFLGPGDDAAMIAALGGVVKSLIKKGQYIEALPLAEEHRQRSRETLAPHDVEFINSLFRLGQCYSAVSRFEEAIECREELLALRDQKLGADDPKTISTRRVLAADHREIGNISRAIELEEQILAAELRKAGDNHEETLNTRASLIEHLREAGRLGQLALLYEGEVLRCRSRLEASSGQEDIVKAQRDLAAAHNSLAWLLATAPDDSVRNGARAVELAELACESTRYEVPGYVDTLATAHAEAGEFEKAAKLMEQVLAVDDSKYSASSSNAESLRIQFTARHKLFQSQTPYREPLSTDVLPQDDLLTDGSFLDVETRHWFGRSWTGKRMEINMDAEQVRSAPAALRIQSDVPDDVGIYQKIRVTPHTRYLLAGWIKTSGVSGGRGTAGASLSVWGGYERSREVRGTGDWNYVTVVFDSGDREEVEVGARLGHHGSEVTGTAWFDDLRLLQLAKPKPRE